MALFESWQSLGRTVLFGLVAYLALVFFLRVAGKRTISMMDPFDFVVATALGSTLAQVVLSKDVSMADGLAAFAVLIGLQFVVLWLGVRVEFVRRAIKPDPVLLFYRGQFLRRTMKREHVDEVEVLAAMRESGMASRDDVEAVVLEADSGFSVVKRTEDKEATTLSDVAAHEDAGVPPPGRSSTDA